MRIRLGSIWSTTFEIADPPVATHGVSFCDGVACGGACGHLQQIVGLSLRPRFRIGVKKVPTAATLQPYNLNCCNPEYLDL